MGGRTLNISQLQMGTQSLERLWDLSKATQQIVCESAVQTQVGTPGLPGPEILTTTLPKATMWDIWFYPQLCL